MKATSKPLSRVRRATDDPHSIDEILRQAIHLGVLRPGTPLIQETLAEQLGVSRIPVRESLRALEAEGVVTFVTGRGAMVSDLSYEEIDELYSLRLLLEEVVTDSVVRNVDPQQFKTMESTPEK